MDLNEVTDELLYRHPWELSRTKCVLDSISGYLDRLHRHFNSCSYVNIGAGDLYFDKALLKKYDKDQVHAVDIGYTDLSSKHSQIHKYLYMDELPERSLHYAIMMDSLEYMEDDTAYVRKVSRKLIKGGYFFFTLPAFPGLFSQHDVTVKNLRRYDRQSIDRLLAQIPELKRIECHYFYTSLFLVRFVQKLLHIPIDPKHKITAKWKFSQHALLTRFLTASLTLDFQVNRLFSRIGVRLPGLSMLVVCRKVR